LHYIYPIKLNRKRTKNSQKLEINYLKHNQIDKQKWDSVIENAENGLVYAFSWYLDIVSPKWDALVVGDYERVMPLTHKRKYGIKYLIQPPFCQQLGVFPFKMNHNVDLFLNQISGKFKFIDINLNYCNSLTQFKKIERINSILNLDKPYEFIQNNYSVNAKRNIKKVQSANLSIIEDYNFKTIFDFKRKNAVEQINNSNYKALFQILKRSSEIKKGEGYAVHDNSGNLLSAVFLIKDLKRIILLISISSNAGKEKLAMFLLLDYIIKKYSGQNYIFDFEGGSIEGIKRFFEGFGAQKEIYTRIRMNNLQWPLNLIKKQ